MSAALFYSPEHQRRHGSYLFSSSVVASDISPMARVAAASMIVEFLEKRRRFHHD
jgi:hypothetical protein